MTVVIRTPFLSDLIALARSEAPNEAVGLITLKHGREGLWRAQNGAEDPEHSFAITAGEQTRLLREIEEAGEEVVGIFHSNPHAGAAPSTIDYEVARSHPKQLLWVIVGLHEGVCAPGIFADYLIP